MRFGESANNQWGRFVWVDRQRTTASQVHIFFRWANTQGSPPAPQEITWWRDSTPDAIWAPWEYRSDTRRRLLIDVQPDQPAKNAWVCLMFAGPDGTVQGGTHWDPSHRDAQPKNDCGK